MKYLLHYIGSGLYNKEQFIIEAEKFNVNRCLPIHIINKITWGQKILLATFTPKQIEKNCGICKLAGTEQCKDDVNNLSCYESIDKIDKRKFKKEGMAEIFGYFTVSGINITASDDFKKDLQEKLTIIESKELNIEVSRQCGSYILSTVNTVADTINFIADNIYMIEQIRHEKAKVFLTGKFTRFDKTIESISFCRATMEVDISENLQDEIKETTIGIIKNYNKRTHINKQAHRGRPRKEKINNG